MEGIFHAHQLDQILFLLHHFVGFSTTDGYNYAAFGFMLFILHTIIWRHSALKEFEKKVVTCWGRRMRREAWRHGQA